MNNSVDAHIISIQPPKDNKCQSIEHKQAEDLVSSTIRLARKLEQIRLEQERAILDHRTANERRKSEMDELAQLQSKMTECRHVHSEEL